MDRALLAAAIDHTLLDPLAGAGAVEQLCAEAVEWQIGQVCVSPSRVGLAAKTLAGSPVVVCSVIGFPSGAHTAAMKAAEAAQALTDGATEVDMVIDLGRARAGDWGAVEADVAAVRAACGDALLKVILESAALDLEQVALACGASERGGAWYVKTSTGFHPAGGATEHAVQLMRSTVGDRLGVKASGGIRTREAAEAMVAAGASRLGLSSSRTILEGGIGSGY